MKTLRNHIVENSNAARGARNDQRRDPTTEPAPVRGIRSLSDGVAAGRNRTRDASRAHERVLACACSPAVSRRGRHRGVCDRHALAGRSLSGLDA